MLIASAIDPDVHRRFLESPDKTFDEFDIAEEDRELLRHPDHRLLRVLGAALADENTIASAAASVATVIVPPVADGSPLAEAPQGRPTAKALPDLSLVLTLVPCSLDDGGEPRKFAYAAWVTPLPEGADPETLPPPAGLVFPGKPLPPLRAVVRVSALEMQDSAGDSVVGLSASLLRSSNLSAQPHPEAAGNPPAIGRDHSTAQVQAAVAAVRGAPTGARYGKLIELLRVVHPEGAS